MQFAAGQLSDALGVMVACHLENCPECRQQAQTFEQLGGELMEELVPAPMSPDFFSKVMEQLNSVDDNIVLPVSVDPRLPKPLQRFLPNTVEDLPWYGFSKNIQQFDLAFSDSHYTAKFYKIKAGKELPEHTHRGNEFTLVMSGAFSDDAGSYHEGDFILADTTTKHRPKAHDDCDCICFAVMDAPLKLTGFWGKMLNPFLR